MNSTIKTRILSLIKAIILIFSGYILSLMGGYYKSVNEYNAIFLIIGLLMIGTGIYFAYEFLTGSRNKDAPAAVADDTSASSSSSVEDATIRRLHLLKDLYELDILTEEEFSEKKKKLLDL